MVIVNHKCMEPEIYGQGSKDGAQGQGRLLIMHRSLRFMVKAPRVEPKDKGGYCKCMEPEIYGQ